MVKLLSLRAVAPEWAKFLVRSLLKKGASVCVVDINEKTAKATADEIIAAGGKAKAYAIDITNEAAVEALFDDAVATFGRLDVYFTIAGISPVGTAVTTSYADYKKVVALDMDSVFLGSKYCIPHMIKNRWWRNTLIWLELMAFAQHRIS